MHDTTAIAAPQPQTSHYVGNNSNPRYAELYRHYPTIDYLRRGARRRLPHFAFEYARRRLGQGRRRHQAQLGGARRR